jgi:iron complex outermembrane receptor protein
MAVFSAAVLSPLSANAAGTDIGRADTTLPGARRTSEPAPEKLESIVVTGTRLPLGKSEGAQQVNVYTREQIDQSGQRTIGDFLNTLPDVSISFTEGAFQSQSGQTTVNLHGLPAGTTLVLINGRRVQDSAITLGSSFASNFFDLNYIPLSMVERIEVLPEGASAVYGSDAIAGVVNIILRQQFSGAEANVRYSHANNLPEWDADFGVGRQWDRGAFMLLGSVQQRDALSGFDRAVTATQDHAADGGLDTRETYCPTPNVYGINGANLPGLGKPYAAVPPGFTGTPSIAEFTGTAGTLNKCSLYAHTSSVPKTRREGVFAQGYLDLNASVQLFAEFLGSHVREEFSYYPFPARGVPSFQRYTIPASNPYNPFGTTVGIGSVFTYAPVSYQSDGTFIRPLLGLRGAFGSDWQWESTVVYSRDRETYTQPNEVPDTAAIQARFNSTDPAVAFNPFVDAPFDSPEFDSTVFHPYIQNYSASDLGVEAFARGTLLQIPSGPVRVVAGAEYHRYRLYTDNGNYANVTFGPPGVPASYYRNSYAIFGEGRIPIIANFAGPQGPAALQATVAVRYDHFSDFGSTTNPQYGLEWRPVESLLLRAAYGETFRAPPLYDLYSTVVRNYPNFVRDPQQGNQTVPVTILTGGNVDLRPETGSTTSFGAVYSTRNLEAAVRQWRIKESSNIQKLSPQTLVNNPDLIPGAVVRDSSGALVLVNATLLNFGSIEVEGVSFQLGCKYPSPWGLWAPWLAATYTYKYDVALTPGSPAVNAVSQAQDTNTWAPRWKGSVGLVWSMADLTINGIGRYVGSYQDYDSTRRIGNFWYFDLNAKYTLPKSTFGTAFIELGAINLFDRLPQVSRYQFGFVGYDPAQADIRGRVLYVRLGGAF